MDENVIPVITHPLGKAWDQPDKDNVLVDNKNALMSKKSFNELLEYSCSQPSGVYEGKMWKSQYNGTWYLKWFDFHSNPEYVSTKSREIIIA